MEEDSTPEDQSTDTGDQAADQQPDPSQKDSGKASADSGDDDTSKTGDDDNAPSDSEDSSAADDKSDASKSGKDAPAFDKDLDEWAVKRGYEKPENDRERKLMQDIRNGQREFSRRQAASKSTKDLADKIKDVSKPGEEDEEDPMVKRLNSMESDLATERNNRRTSEYFMAQAEAGNPVSDEEAAAMSTLLEQYAKENGQTGVNFLLSNLPRWHRLAKLELEESTGDTTDEEKEKIRQEEREKLAKSSNAKPSPQSARQTATADKKDEVQKIWEDDSI